MATSACTLSRGKRRILIVDDNPDIHCDFGKVLSLKYQDELSAEEAELFGEENSVSSVLPCYQIDSAYQGQEALNKVITAYEQGRPYALGFIDMRMPPGWSGLRTIQEIWRIDPDFHAVICSAYCDQSWNDILEQLGVSSRLLVVQKPFSSVEIQQAALTLSHKFELEKRLNELLETIER